MPGSGGWDAVARAGQKQQDQKNDRGRDLVKRDEEKGQPAHRAGVDEDEVAINEQRENGGRRGNEQSGDSSATAASSKKACAAEEPRKGGVRIERKPAEQPGEAAKHVRSAATVVSAPRPSVARVAKLVLVKFIGFRSYRKSV